jgi:hypothetical protein
MSEYVLIPSQFFLEQLEDLSDEAIRVLEKKLLLLKTNPFRFKRIEGFSLFLFRIRFEDRRKEKRLVYLVDKPWVKLICLLDRDSDYKERRSFLKRHQYI